jgi:hypothetical protein
MSLETFRRCLELVARSANPVHGGRKFVWLNHFGEPLLNLLLPRFVAEATARKVAGFILLQRRRYGEEPVPTGGVAAARGGGPTLRMPVGAFPYARKVVRPCRRHRAGARRLGAPRAASA